MAFIVTTTVYPTKLFLILVQARLSVYKRKMELKPRRLLQNNFKRGRYPEFSFDSLRYVIFREKPLMWDGIGQVEVGQNNASHMEVVPDGLLWGETEGRKKSETALADAKGKSVIDWQLLENVL